MSSGCWRALNDESEPEEDEEVEEVEDQALSEHGSPANSESRGEAGFVPDEGDSLVMDEDRGNGVQKDADEAKAMSAGETSVGENSATSKDASPKNERKRPRRSRRSKGNKIGEGIASMELFPEKKPLKSKRSSNDRTRRKAENFEAARSKAISAYESAMAKFVNSEPGEIAWVEARTEFAQLLELKILERKEMALGATIRRCVLQNLARMDEAEGSEKSALTKFLEAAAIESKDFFTWLSLGQASLRNGSFYVAEAAFEEAIRAQREKQNTEALVGLALASLANANQWKCAAAVSETLEMDPSCEKAYIVRHLLRNSLTEEHMKAIPETFLQLVRSVKHHISSFADKDGLVKSKAYDIVEVELKLGKNSVAEFLQKLAGFVRAEQREGVRSRRVIKRIFVPEVQSATTSMEIEHVAALSDVSTNDAEKSMAISNAAEPQEEVASASTKESTKTPASKGKEGSKTRTSRRRRAKVDSGEESVKEAFHLLCDATSSSRGQVTNGETPSLKVLILPEEVFERSAKVALVNFGQTDIKQEESMHDSAEQKKEASETLDIEQVVHAFVTQQQSSLPDVASRLLLQTLRSLPESRCLPVPSAQQNAFAEALVDCAELIDGLFPCLFSDESCMGNIQRLVFFSEIYMDLHDVLVGSNTSILAEQCLDKASALAMTARSNLEVLVAPSEGGASIFEFEARLSWVSHKICRSINKEDPLNSVFHLKACQRFLSQLQDEKIALKHILNDSVLTSEIVKAKLKYLASKRKISDVKEAFLKAKKEEKEQVARATFVTLLAYFGDEKPNISDLLDEELDLKCGPLVGTGKKKRPSSSKKGDNAELDALTIMAQAARKVGKPEMKKKFASFLVLAWKGLCEKLEGNLLMDNCSRQIGIRSLELADECAAITVLIEKCVKLLVEPCRGEWKFDIINLKEDLYPMLKTTFRLVEEFRDSKTVIESITEVFATGETERAVFEVFLDVLCFAAATFLSAAPQNAETIKLSRATNALGSEGRLALLVVPQFHLQQLQNNSGLILDCLSVLIRSCGTIFLSADSANALRRPAAWVSKLMVASVMKVLEICIFLENDGGIKLKVVKLSHVVLRMLDHIQPVDRKSKAAMFELFVESLSAPSTIKIFHELKPPYYNAMEEARQFVLEEIFFLFHHVLEFAGENEKVPVLNLLEFPDEQLYKFPPTKPSWLPDEFAADDTRLKDFGGPIALSDCDLKLFPLARFMLNHIESRVLSNIAFTDNSYMEKFLKYLISRALYEVNSPGPFASKIEAHLGDANSIIGNPTKQRRAAGSLYVEFASPRSDSRRHECPNDKVEMEELCDRLPFCYGRLLEGRLPGRIPSLNQKSQADALEAYMAMLRKVCECYQLDLSRNPWRFLSWFQFGLMEQRLHRIRFSSAEICADLVDIYRSERKEGAILDGEAMMAKKEKILLSGQDLLSRVTLLWETAIFLGQNELSSIDHSARRGFRRLNRVEISFRGEREEVGTITRVNSNETYDVCYEEIDELDFEVPRDRLELFGSAVSLNLVESVFDCLILLGNFLYSNLFWLKRCSSNLYLNAARHALSCFERAMELAQNYETDAPTLPKHYCVYMKTRISEKLGLSEATEILQGYRKALQDAPEKGKDAEICRSEILCSLHESRMKYLSQETELKSVGRREFWFNSENENLDITRVVVDSLEALKACFVNCEREAHRAVFTYAKTLLEFSDILPEGYGKVDALEALKKIFDKKASARLCIMWFPEYAIQYDTVEWPWFKVEVTRDKYVELYRKLCKDTADYESATGLLQQLIEKRRSSDVHRWGIFRSACALVETIRSILQESVISERFRKSTSTYSNSSSADTDLFAEKSFGIHAAAAAAAQASSGEEVSPEESDAAQKFFDMLLGRAYELFLESAELRLQMRAANMGGETEKRMVSSTSAFLENAFLMHKTKTLDPSSSAANFKDALEFCEIAYSDVRAKYRRAASSFKTRQLRATNSSSSSTSSTSAASSSAITKRARPAASASPDASSARKKAALSPLVAVPPPPPLPPSEE